MTAFPLLAAPQSLCISSGALVARHPLGVVILQLLAAFPQLDREGRAEVVDTPHSQICLTSEPRAPLAADTVRIVARCSPDESPCSR